MTKEDLDKQLRQQLFQKLLDFEKMYIVEASQMRTFEDKRVIEVKRDFWHTVRQFVDDQINKHKDFTGFGIVP